MMGDLKNYKIKENNWKVKAVERAVEIRRLRKCLSEVDKSRAYWKNKYFQKQLSEKKLFREHPAGHQYPVVVIWLCLYVYNSCQCSFRNCCTMVMGCSMAFQFRCKKPCAATIRTKARFQNIFPIIDWLEKIEQHWKEIPPEAQEAMSFIQTNQPLIRELKLLRDTIKQMGALLKVTGMNSQTLQACKAMLSVCKNGRPLEFKKRLLQDWEVYESDPIAIG